MRMTSLILVLICLFFARTQSQWALRQYIIEKDFFTGIKSGGFSVYDHLRKNLLYRFESRYVGMPTGELYVYPGEQMVASMQKRWSVWMSKVDIHIYDPVFRQWISGKINQSFSIYPVQYAIQYGNRRLIMEQKAFSLTTEIRDEQQLNFVLARIKSRLTSILWSDKYDLQVYTNEFPDAVYLLALIMHDYNDVQRIRHRQNGK